MKRVVAENAPFKRFELPRAEAHWKMESAGQPYKTELIEGFEEDRVSFYSSGAFTDVCAGPHLPSTGVCGNAFKLLNVAGAYWRGDERNAMLQRIYGTAFWTQQALDDYLKQLEEARKRDHRVLGKQLELFHHQRRRRPGPGALDAQGRRDPRRAGELDPRPSCASAAISTSSPRTSASSASTAPAGTTRITRTRSIRPSSSARRSSCSPKRTAPARRSATGWRRARWTATCSSR